MFVSKRMTAPVITTTPDTPITEALNLMKSKNIRRLPVVKNGKLVGIVSDKDLLHASPSQATSLSIWEMNYLLSKITIEKVMTTEVLTVSEDTPIEEAARIMADNKIGGLPVVRNGEVVGMITETDLFKAFLELMGAREAGVRASVVLPDVQGRLAELARVIANAGGNFIAFGAFTGDAPNTRVVTFKVTGLSAAQMKELITPVISELVDLRE